MKEQFESMAVKFLEQAQEAVMRGDTHGARDLVAAAALCADKAWMFDEARNKPTY